MKNESRYNRYRFFEKIFIIMPLMNSEYISDVTLSKNLLNKMKTDAEL